MFPMDHTRSSDLSIDSPGSERRPLHRKAEDTLFPRDCSSEMNLLCKDIGEGRSLKNSQESC